VNEWANISPWGKLNTWGPSSPPGGGQTNVVKNWKTGLRFLNPHEPLNDACHKSSSFQSLLYNLGKIAGVPESIQKLVKFEMEVYGLIPDRVKENDTLDRFASSLKR
jgi:hypothetical protein